MPGWVQGTGAGVTTPSGTIAYGSNVTQGNLLVAFIYSDAGPPAPGITDTLNNNWVQVYNGNDAGGSQVTVLACIANASGADTLTVSQTGSTYNNTYLGECNGVTYVGANVTEAAAASGTTPSTGSTTPIAQGLMLAWFHTTNGASGTSTPNAPFSVGWQSGSTGALISYWSNGSTTTSTSTGASASGTADTWQTVIIGLAPPAMVITPNTGTLGFDSQPPTATDTDLINWNHEGGIGSPVGYRLVGGRMMLPRGPAAFYNPTYLGELDAIWLPFEANEYAQPLIGGLSMQGYAPSVQIGTGALTVQPNQGTLTAAGAAPPLITANIPNAGTLTMTGPAASLGRGAAPGTASMLTAGLAAALTTANVPNAGTASMTGPAGALTTTNRPNTGTLTAQGASSGVTVGFAIVPNTGSMLAAGAAGALTVAIVPGAGTLLASGAAAALTTTNIPNAGTLTAAGQAPAVAAGAVRTPNAGSLLAQGAAPVLTAGAVRTPVQGTLTAAGAAAFMDRGLSPGTGALLAAGLAGPLQTAIVPGAGTLLLQGIAPSLGFSYIVQPGAGTVQAQGIAPSVLLMSGIGIQPNTGTLSLAGYAPSALVPILAQPNAGTLTLQGFAPQAGISYSVQPNTGALLGVGYAPVLGMSYTVQPGAGALTVTGPAAIIVTTTPFLAPGSATLGIVGYGPSVTFGVIVTPVQAGVELGGLVLGTGHAPAQPALTVTEGPGVPAGGLQLGTRLAPQQRMAVTATGPGEVFGGLNLGTARKP